MQAAVAAVPTPTPVASGGRAFTNNRDPYYAIHYVPDEDLPKVKALGAEVVLRDISDHGTPAEWLAILDLYQTNGLKLLAWFWEPGWEWNEGAHTWDITDQAQLFLKTVEGHPALLAVYMLHEPYWNNCRGCGWTTDQQQHLYRQIKEIADVPLFSTPGSIALEDERGPNTRFDVDVCDYCAVWRYPFKAGVPGIDDKEEMIQMLQEEIDLVRVRSPDSKVVWILQGFAQDPPANLRMPTAEEMRELAEIVYSMEIDGAAWYAWTFGDLYNDTLSQRPELHDTIREIYDEVVLPLR